MNGPLQSSLNGLFGGSQTYWNGQYFEEQFNQLSLSFVPKVNLRVGGNIRIEDVVDFANTRPGKSRRFGACISYQWGRHLQINVNHTLQEFEVSDPLLHWLFGHRY
ncbi:MAG: hypothetical protein IIC59_10445 [Proteobacteria bacterium]|nr:hypothetical protein [Pseudomonadota bacterium]